MATLAKEGVVIAELAAKPEEEEGGTLDEKKEAADEDGILGEKEPASLPEVV